MITVGGCEGADSGEGVEGVMMGGEDGVSGRVENRMPVERPADFSTAETKISAPALKWPLKPPPASVSEEEEDESMRGFGTDLVDRLVTLDESEVNPGGLGMEVSSEVEAFDERGVESGEAPKLCNTLKPHKASSTL